MMNRIIAAAENDRAYYRPTTDAARPEPAATIPDAICASMRQATSLLPLAAIVTYTTSGSSSLRASRERPAASILSMAAGVETARRLTLAYGTRIADVLGDATHAGALGPTFGAELTGSEGRHLMNRERARTAGDILWRRSRLGLTMEAADREALAKFMAGATYLSYSQ